MTTIQLLADTGGGGDGLYMSVAAITAIGVAIAAVMKAYRAGVQKGAATTETTIKKPVPTVTIREEAQWATSPDLKAHENRTSDAINQIRTDIDQIHTRLNSAFRKLDTLDGSVSGIQDITGKLLDLALGLPQGTTAARARKPSRNE